MEFENIIKEYNVSRETLLRLEKFVFLLHEWNKKMNLVSSNAFNDIWIRHVADSMQLIDYIPNKTNFILDIGSGSGFPGVILAIMLEQISPMTKICLVESIKKKTVYLKDICEKLELKNVTIVNNRVENTVFKNVDIITARAVASIDKLCSFSYKILSPNTKMLLLKGKSYVLENEDAEKNWHYDLKIYKNKYSSDGVVLELFNIRKKK